MVQLAQAQSRNRGDAPGALGAQDAPGAPGAPGAQAEQIRGEEREEEEREMDEIATNKPESVMAYMRRTSDTSKRYAKVFLHYKLEWEEIATFGVSERLTYHEYAPQ